MSLHVELPDELIEQIAERAAKLLAEREPPPEAWLNVEQAAEHLAISVSHVYSLCSRRGNGFPVVKEGSRSFFERSALDAWRRVNNNPNGGPP